jgi:hypothetical protein
MKEWVERTEPPDGCSENFEMRGWSISGRLHPLMVSDAPSFLTIKFLWPAVKIKFYFFYTDLKAVDFFKH